jgi:hypothetical protein
VADARGVPADEVHYYDGGWWPAYADGGGSSLELVDVRADNDRSGAWAASAEGARAVWRGYTYRGVAAADNGPTQWNELVMGLIDGGEALVDNVSVIEVSSGNEFMQQGTFETGGNRWRMIGNHRHSAVVEDPDVPGGHVLHLVATGPTEHMHNHLETTYASGRRVTNGREYEISFRARWLGGSNQLNTRLYFNRVARTTRLEIPRRRGTPGKANSVAADNVGPTMRRLRHLPAVPEPGEAVTCSVVAEDPDEVAGCMLWWSAEGGAWQSSAMAAMGGGAYVGAAPGYGPGTVVQWYVEAVDTRGATSLLPPEGPGSRALWCVNDGQADLGERHNLRIIVTPADAELLFRTTNVMSNEALGATVIYDEREVYDDVGVRLRSSQRGRYHVDRVGFHIECRSEKLFLGVHRSISIDRAGGWGLGISRGHDEIVIKHIANHAGGIPGMYDDMVQLVGPRPAYSGPALLMLARYSDIYLDGQYENGSQGQMHNYELVYYPTTTTDGNPESLKLPQPDTVVGVDFTDLGDNKEAYRWFFNLESNRDGDDYSGLIRQCKLYSVSDAQMVAAAAEVMDVDAWMGTFVLYSLCGVNDAYMYGNYHNLKVYVRPSDGRTLGMPWDMDWCWTSGRETSSLWSTQGNLRRVIERTPYTRMYYRHLQNVVETTFNNGYMNRWIDHYGSMAEQNYSRIKSFISTRAAYVLERLPAEVPFAITTHGGEDFSVDATTVTIDGTAPIEIAEIKLNGSALAVTWRTVTTWRVDIPLASGPNDFEFAGFDMRGDLVGALNVTITSLVNYNPPRIDIMNPIEGPSTGGTAVQLYGLNFMQGVRVFFGAVEATSVQRNSAVDIVAVTPRGTGAVEVTAVNPDGLTGKGPDLFTYVLVGTLFQRADANVDSAVNIADAVKILSHLFSADTVTCRDALDVNDDGGVDIADAVSILGYIFAQGRPPAEPFNACGVDATEDDLGCDAYTECP